MNENEIEHNAHAYTRIFDGRIRSRILHNLANSFVVDLNNIGSEVPERVLKMSRHNIDNNAYSKCFICEKRTMLYIHSTTAHFESKTNLPHYIYDNENKALCDYKVCLKCYHALQHTEHYAQRYTINTIQKMYIKIRKFYSDELLKLKANIDSK